MCGWLAMLLLPPPPHRLELVRPLCPDCPRPSLLPVALASAPSVCHAARLRTLRASHRATLRRGLIPSAGTRLQLQQLKGAVVNNASAWIADPQSLPVVQKMLDNSTSPLAEYNVRAARAGVTVFDIAARIQVVEPLLCSRHASRQDGAHIAYKQV